MTSVRTVQNGGLFTEAVADGQKADPPIPLGDLAASTIGPVMVGFIGDVGKLADDEDVRDMARRVVRAAAWRRRKGVALPEVTIAGFDGRYRADIVAMFSAEAKSEALRMTGLGLPIGHEDVIVHVVPAGGTRHPVLDADCATLDVSLPPAELGEKEIAWTATAMDTDMELAAIRALNEAFALLAPGQLANNPATAPDVQTVTAVRSRTDTTPGSAQPKPVHRHDSALDADHRPESTPENEGDHGHDD